MSGTLLNPGPYTATSTQYDQGSEQHHAAASSRIRIWVAGPVAAACLAGSMTFGAVAAPAEATTPLEGRTYTPQVRYGRSSQAQVDAAAHLAAEKPASARTTTAASVSHLHDHSGLTWDQLGKLFGVSRRAVHMWASGKRMNARNTELLAELLRLINSAPGETAEERRAWLFAPRADGVTPIERFLDEHRRPGQPLSGSGYTPAGLLGMTDE